MEIKDKLSREIKDLLLSTAKHLKHKKQLILIPITMYSGFEQAFYNAEFSKVPFFLYLEKLNMTLPANRARNYRTISCYVICS